MSTGGKKILGRHYFGKTLCVETQSERSIFITSPGIYNSHKDYEICRCITYLCIFLHFLQFKALKNHLKSDSIIGGRNRGVVHTWTSSKSSSLKRRGEGAIRSIQKYLIKYQLFDKANIHFTNTCIIHHQYGMITHLIGIYVRYAGSVSE